MKDNCADIIIIIIIIIIIAKKKKDLSCFNFIN